MRTRSLLLVVVPGVALAVTEGAYARSVTYLIQADGFQEVLADGTPNQGDLDATAVGTIRLDDGTGSGNTGFADIDVTISGIEYVLGAWHIHQAPAGSNGPIVLDFGNPETIRNGNALSTTVTGLSAAIIGQVFDNPSGFYFNLHSPPTGPFPAGAVRDQLSVVPTPAAVMLGGAIGAVAMFRRRRP